MKCEKRYVMLKSGQEGDLVDYEDYGESEIETIMHSLKIPVKISTFIDEYSKISNLIEENARHILSDFICDGSKYFTYPEFAIIEHGTTNVVAAIFLAFEIDEKTKMPQKINGIIVTRCDVNEDVHKDLYQAVHNYYSNKVPICSLKIFDKSLRDMIISGGDFFVKDKTTVERKP